jgi:hypothetical protein
MKLTNAQVIALTTIENERVEAYTRLARGMKRVNGNCERKLHDLGLIEQVYDHNFERLIHGRMYRTEINRWVLTANGNAALRALDGK